MRVAVVTWTWLGGIVGLASAMAQSDSLSVDSVPQDIVVDWERQWAEWCSTAHCVSSDTSLWAVEDVGVPPVGAGLDSASVASRMALLDQTSGLDLRWNPIAQRRIETYGTKRTRHLGTMLGRSAM